MRNLKEYIEKHGQHLTIELVLDVVAVRWSPEEIEKSIQAKVYYNTTSSTLGDMIYLVNAVYDEKRRSKTKCIDYTLSKISNFSLGEGFAFKYFIDTLYSQKEEFDFTPYI